MTTRAHYEVDRATFSANAYSVKGHRGVAFRVLGWETKPDGDTEWSGHETRTGRVAVVMIGDDYRWDVDESDITPIAREDYCSECGQIGCGHDGLDR